jgi:DNA-binding NarL/FixJ family response regulator
MILDHEQGIEVVGLAADGAQSIQQARDLLPDVVLPDIRMPGVGGLSAIASITELGARVLILTTFDVDENIYRAFRAVASGFILKTAHPEDLVHAVRVVARGDALVNRESRAGWWSDSWPGPWIAARRPPPRGWRLRPHSVRPGHV